MARKQTRRTVSLNRDVYDEIMRVAERRGVSAAEIVTEALRKVGHDIPSTEHLAANARARAIAGRVEARARAMSGWVNRG